MKKGFRIIDHTADVGMAVRGGNLGEILSNAAVALFSLITDLDQVAEESRFDVEVKADDSTSLLVDWLNELVYLFDTRHVLLCRFEMLKVTERELEAACYGEAFDPSKHKLMREIKAATYHMLTLERHGGALEARVILDI